MILAALMLLQAAPPSASPDGAEIAVITQHLRKLRLDASMSRGGVTMCRPRVSSGDEFIDREACKALSLCVNQGVRNSAQLMTCVDNRIKARVLATRTTKD